ncbi:MAG: endonuclease/exonuclease/phosphatase family protein [Bacteroidales bacterium]|nr:endonuclease/exonuclease/phosphatase family protein [Bacteroidales bacterium]MCF8457554.1 endonuclease/exonuclease/phosphatase family protein [Bacteroidales bacterium]
MRLKLTIFLIHLFAGYLLRAQVEPTPTYERTVKVLSFNIYHGETMKGDFNLDAIAQVVINADADFVALQEVDHKTNRAHNYDLATELGWRTKMSPLFGKAMNYDGGEYGEGILSKFTFLQTRNVPLPFSPGNEPRAALEIISVLPSGDTIAFIGTHLDHLEDETDRVAQVKKINEEFFSNRYPTILAGDMNALPGSKAINILEEIWAPLYNKSNPTPTYPSNNPEKKIDYVMFYPATRWHVLSTEVICDSVASDHCAYLVTLELLTE